MSNGTLTPEQRKQLTAERQKAVRQAWKEEKQRVLEGKGTRQWTNDEKKELISRGSVPGYEGHHMKSVSKYPQFAGDSKNIQFLPKKSIYMVLTREAITIKQMVTTILKQKK